MSSYKKVIWCSIEVSLLCMEKLMVALIVNKKLSYGGGSGANTAITLSAIKNISHEGGMRAKNTIILIAIKNFFHRRGDVAMAMVTLIVTKNFYSSQKGNSGFRPIATTNLPYGGVGFRPIAIKTSPIGMVDWLEKKVMRVILPIANNTP